MVGVNIPVDRADLGAEHALKRHRVRIDHGDLQASLTGRCRHFAADPASADHDEPAAPLDPLA